MSDLLTGLRELTAARPALDEAEAMYEGTQAEVFASAAVRRAMGDTGGKFRLNYARAIVGARLDKLEISSVTCDSEAETKLIAELWDTLDMADETHDVHEALGEFGEAVAIVWPSEATGETITAVDVFYNDPRTARIVYSAENPRVPAFCVKVWTVDLGAEKGKRTRVNLYYPDRLERYISVTEQTGQTTAYADSDFIPFIDDALSAEQSEDGEEYPGTWPIPAPIEGKLNAFHFRTGRPHGRPLHFDAYGPQNAINKLIATQMGNVDFTGLPQRYVLVDDAATGGVAAVDADFADDEIEIGSDPALKDEDEGLKSEPGGVWKLRNARGTGTYSAADPSVFLDPWDKFVQGMSVTTKTPMSAFRISAEMPSGAARRADDEPLNGHVRDLQRRAGATWANVYEYVVELLTGKEVKVAVTWEPLESFDDQDTWDVAAAQIAAGVPARQALLERGYTAEELTTWGIPEFNTPSASQNASDTAQTAAMLRDLSTAQALGGVTPEQMQQVVAKLVPTSAAPVDGN